MAINASKKMRKVYESNGNSFPAYTSVGCYDLIYVDAENNILCADCANKNDSDYDPKILEYFASCDSDGAHYCDQCSKCIVKAWDDESEDSE